MVTFLYHGKLTHGELQFNLLAMVQILLGVLVLVECSNQIVNIVTFHCIIKAKLRAKRESSRADFSILFAKLELPLFRGLVLHFLLHCIYGWVGGNIDKTLSLSSLSNTLHKMFICKYILMSVLLHLIKELLSFAFVGPSYTYIANIWNPSLTLSTLTCPCFGVQSSTYLLLCNLYQA